MRPYHVQALYAAGRAEPRFRADVPAQSAGRLALSEERGQPQFAASGCAMHAVARAFGLTITLGSRVCRYHSASATYAAAAAWGSLHHLLRIWMTPTAPPPSAKSRHGQDGTRSRQRPQRYGHAAPRGPAPAPAVAHLREPLRRQLIRVELYGRLHLLAHQVLRGGRRRAAPHVSLLACCALQAPQVGLKEKRTHLEGAAVHELLNNEQAAQAGYHDTSRAGRDRGLAAGVDCGVGRRGHAHAQGSAERRWPSAGRLRNVWRHQDY
jgi:hypothetical protein